MEEFPLEPFKIKVVEPIRCPDHAERIRALHEAHYNLFALHSDKVFIDLLTDSGTSAMSEDQWAGMMLGDESYAGSRNFYNFQDTVREIFGFEHVIPTHQGRAAEHLLFTAMVKRGQFVPNNTHFDTTRANIEYLKAVPVDCPLDTAFITQVVHPFKGGMDLVKLRNVIETHGKEKIPMVILTLTNNAVGGQPVSMKNISGTKELLKDYNIPLYIDACRYAENAFFIKEQELGYKNVLLTDIVREVFSYADGCYMSAKKDALVNIGGFIATNNSSLAEKLQQHLILTEGFPTYGGLARRDLEAIARGLKEGINYQYLKHRIEQVHFLGRLLQKESIPVVLPLGGHAVYIDAARFLPNIPLNQFPAQALTCALYLEGGVRACELGSVSFPKNGQGTGLELVRLAIPRRVYTCCHLEYVSEIVSRVYKKRDRLKGLRITYSAPFLRHFTARFEEIGNNEQGKGKPNVTYSSL